MISRRAILRGKVNIGKNSTIQDNVVLGSLEDGKLEIGKNSLIRSGTIIYSNVKIGEKLRTGHNVLIRENTVIGNSSLIGTNSVIDGDCRIGNNVKIQTSVYIARYTTIEDDAFLGPCCVTTNDKYMQYGAKLKGSTIKKRARIGANATILPSVVIGENAVIGAGTIVTKDVKRDEIVYNKMYRECRRFR